MAKTLTDLEYGSNIAEIQRQIARSQAQEEEALKDLQAWAAQIEDQRARGAADAAAAWEQGIQQAQTAQANINQLFGGAGGPEGAAYGQAGIDMLSALAASDKSFDARMAPILAAQSLDYKRRASGLFNQQQQELQGNLRDLRREKGQAFQKNLLDLMNVAWQRRQDLFQNRLAQEALNQSKAMAELDIEAKKLGIESDKLDIQAQKIALEKSTLELQKIATQDPSGINWDDPSTRSMIGNAAFAGAINKNDSTFIVNPKIALANAMTALAQMGLEKDPRAIQAVRNTFVQLLRLSHAHKKWVKWRINKNGQLIYAPAANKPAIVRNKRYPR
jgi:hypothetical protein